MSDNDYETPEHAALGAQHIPSDEPQHEWFSSVLDEVRKPIWRSKTFWLQVITLLSLVFPQVRDFISKNPEQFVSVIAALNVIVRFLTKGRVTLFSSGEEGSHGSASGWMPLLTAGLVALWETLPGLAV